MSTGHAVRCEESAGAMSLPLYCPDCGRTLNSCAPYDLWSCPGCGTIFTSRCLRELEIEKKIAEAGKTKAKPPEKVVCPVCGNSLEKKPGSPCSWYCRMCNRTFPLGDDTKKEKKMGGDIGIGTYSLTGRQIQKLRKTHGEDATVFATYSVGAQEEFLTVATSAGMLTNYRWNKDQSELVDVTTEG